MLQTIHLYTFILFFLFCCRDPLDLSASRIVQTYVTSVLDCLDHCNNMYKFLQWLAFPFHVKRSRECLPAGASEQDHCFTAFTSDVAQWCCLKIPILGNNEVLRMQKIKLCKDLYIIFTHKSRCIFVVVVVVFSLLYQKVAQKGFHVPLKPRHGAAAVR